MPISACPSRPAAFSRGGNGEGQVVALDGGLLVEPRDTHERRHAESRIGPEGLKTVADEDAVLVDQGDHVGHGADGRQAHRLQQEGPHPLADAVVARCPLAQGPRQLECNRRAAEPVERVPAVGERRMNQRRRPRQSLAELVMVGDHKPQAQLRREVGLGGAGDAAVDRHDRAFALLGEFVQRVCVEPVALVDAMGDVVVDLGTQEPQAPQEDGGGGHAVGVVVAVDGDRLTRTSGVVEDLRRGRCTGELGRVAQAVELGGEKRTGHLGVVHAPGHEQPGDHRGDPRGLPEPGHFVGVAPRYAPLLGHREGGLVREEESDAAWQNDEARMTNDEPLVRASSSGSRHFFFSVCMVWRRSLGQYFFSFSFSPPTLRRRV